MKRESVLLLQVLAVVIVLLILSLLWMWFLYYEGIIPYTNESIKAEENVVVEEVVYDVHILKRTKDVNYMYGIATAYTPSAGGTNCDSNPEVTSTMAPAVEGVIAVNPDVIPYGSEVLIICGKTVIRGTALDTGGAMKKNPHQVDILMEDYKKALEWGRREVHIIWW